MLPQKQETDKEGETQEEESQEEEESEPDLGEEQEEEEEVEGKGMDIVYLVSSFMFISIFITELDLTTQQSIATLYTYLFYDRAFDYVNEMARPDIGSPEELKQYLVDGLLPQLLQKKDKTYFTGDEESFESHQSYEFLQEKQASLIGDFNFFVGLRMTMKQAYFKENQSKKSKTVLPEYQPYHFDEGAFEAAYQDSLSDPIELTAYDLDPSETYTLFISSQLSLKEAYQKIDMIEKQGFFDEKKFLLFKVEFFTYNLSLKHAGFYSQETYRDAQGNIVNLPGYYQSLFPQNYDGLAGLTLLKLFFIFIYIFCMLIQLLQLIYTFINYFKEYFKRKQLEIAWYDYIDLVAQAFCMQSMYYWFLMFAARGKFQLPIEDTEDFTFWITESLIVKEYLNSSSIAVLLLCLKNLRILTTYFPSFGVLFDTIRRSKTDVMYFFIMCSVFLFGFVLSGHLLFGAQEDYYSNIPKALMSLFQMIVGNFHYGQLEEANPSWALIFFFMYIVMFFLILLNVFLTIVITVYDNLRSQKALESMAKGLIMSRQQSILAKKWFNLLFCQMEKPDVSDSEEEEEAGNQAKQTGEKKTKRLDPQKLMKQFFKKGFNRELTEAEQKRKEKLRLQVENTKTDLKTVFLHNKAKLLEKDVSKKTKEHIENEMNAAKKKILITQYRTRKERVDRFKKLDPSAVTKFKSSVLYVIFIINFTWMLLNQLLIEQSHGAQASMREYMNGQEFVDVSSIFPLHNQSHPASLENAPEIGIEDIMLKPQVADWMQQAFTSYLFGAPQSDKYNSKAKAVYNRNYQFGETLAEIKFRRVKKQKNKDRSTNSTIPYFRETNFLLDSAPSPDEIQKDIIGPYSNKTYNYFKPGIKDSYGSFLVEIPNDEGKAQEIINDMILDGMLDWQTACIQFQSASYNPVYEMFVLTTVQFEFQVTGLVTHNVRARAVKQRLYHSSDDYFRAFQELIYIAFIIYNTCIELIGLFGMWLVVTYEDNQNSLAEPSCENPNLFEKLCLLIGLDYLHVLKQSFPVLVCKLLYAIVTWILKIAIRAVRVVHRYMFSDLFKLFNIISTTISLVLIGTWIQMILKSFITINSVGQTKGGLQTVIELAELYDFYNIFSSVNAIIIYWRILQFFDFSINLSAFTEILKASKSDTLFFMLMFIVILFGYSVMGYSLFGQILFSYSDLFLSTIELFKMLNGAFEYWDLHPVNDLAGFFFVSFMLVFNLLILNMFIAIMMAHYTEFTEFQTGDEDDLQDNNVFQKMLFYSIYDQVCPQSLRDKEKELQGFKRWYVSKWKTWELQVNPPEVEESDHQEAAKQTLQKILSTKFEVPQYERRQIHAFLRPYLEEHISLFNLKNHIKKEENQSQLDSVNEESKEDSERPRSETEESSNSEEADSIENLINVIPKSLRKYTQDQRTSSSSWIAALEKVIGHSTARQIALADFMEPKCFFKFYKPVYSKDNFETEQIKFLMMDFEAKIEMWTVARLSQKFEFWRVMDFQKIHYEQAKFDLDPKEKFTQFLDFMRDSYSGVADSNSCPMVTFRKVNKSPELQDKEYNRISDEMYWLFTQHMSLSEQYDFWFNLLNPYHRIKLWNKLKFSENYTIGTFVNSQQHVRHDISLKLTNLFSQIKAETIEYYQMLIEEKEEEGELGKTFKGRRKLGRLRSFLEGMRRGQVKMEEIVRVAPQEIRDCYLTEDFQLEIWELINTRKYFLPKDVLNQIALLKKQKLDLYVPVAETQAKAQKDRKWRAMIKKMVPKDVFAEIRKQRMLEKQKMAQQAKDEGKPLPTEVRIDTMISQGSDFKKEAEEFVEKTKLDKKQFVASIKAWLNLMVHGIDKQRMFKLQKKRTLRKKFQFLTKHCFDKTEQRLQFWLPLSLEEKQKLYLHQPLKQEADIMAMLINQEIEGMPSSIERSDEANQKLERAFDNEIYEKYRQMTEFQALKITEQQSKARLQRLEREDETCKELFDFYAEKWEELAGSRVTLKEKIAKKMNENAALRAQVEETIKKREGL